MVPNETHQRGSPGGGRLSLGPFGWIASGQQERAPIHFGFHPIDFALDSSETSERHAPETMAGGVAIFDYNNDGNLDIFFTNGSFAAGYALAGAGPFTSVWGRARRSSPSKSVGRPASCRN